MSGPPSTSSAAGLVDPGEPDRSDGSAGSAGSGSAVELGLLGQSLPAVDLGAFIREQRRLGRLSLRKLSELSGISNPYLSQIERGLRRPSADILKQIARALSISVESLYVQAGILDPRQDSSSVIDEIGRDPGLDEDHKRTLIHIYRSFRRDSAVETRG